MSLKALNELQPKEKGKVVKVWGEGSIRRRLVDMGFVTGSDVQVERVAPMGDPVEIKIKGYHLTLRKEEAANVEVEVEGQAARLVPLVMVKPGETVRVVSITGGQGFSRKLSDMGLLSGASIKMVNNGGHGQVIIELGGAEVALGQGVARKIMVSEG
jgi:ferrous iron transport protein A